MNMLLRLGAYWLALGAVATLSSCALLKKPVPVTQIQLSLDYTRINWPVDMKLAGVKARSVLQTDRVIVVQSALVMQHAGVRWVANPSAQLSEQLSFARASALAQLSTTRMADAKNMQLDVWLNDFNIEVLANGDTRIVVSALANIQCSAATLPSQLPAAVREVPLNSIDPQRIAEGFNNAAGAALSKLIASGKALCQAR